MIILYVIKRDFFKMGLMEKNYETFYRNFTNP